VSGRRRWGGVVARLGVPTVDGRVLLPPRDVQHVDGRFPIWLGIVVPGLLLGDASMAAQVGTVDALAVDGDKLTARGVINLGWLPDEMAETLTRGGGVQAGVDLSGYQVNPDYAPGLTSYADWVVSSVVSGPAYESAWGDLCTIKLEGE